MPRRQHPNNPPQDFPHLRNLGEDSMMLNKFLAALLLLQATSHLIKFLSKTATISPEKSKLAFEGISYARIMLSLAAFIYFTERLWEIYQGANRPQNAVPLQIQNAPPANRLLENIANVHTPQNTLAAAQENRAIPEAACRNRRQANQSSTSRYNPTLFSPAANNPAKEEEVNREESRLKK